MSHMVVLNLSDEAYSELVRSASEKGKAPEVIATEILAETLIDPLMKLAGSLSAPVSDLGERHDEYIGQELFRSCRDFE